MYNTKERSNLGSFMSYDGKTLSNSYISLASKKYFISVFIQEDVSSLLEAVPAFKEMKCYAI